MVYIKWQIDYVPFSDGTWDESKRETLTGYRNIILRRFLGENKDSFEFKLTNVNGIYDSKFNVNDKIYIYRAINTETIPDDPLMVGTVRDGIYSDDYAKDVVTVKGYNFSETVMNATVFLDAQTLTIPHAIEQALLDMKAYNGLFSVEWDTNNPMLRSDNSAFPVVAEKFYYKPIRHLIEKYSTANATNDGNYYWFVNQSNKMIWKRGEDFDDSNFDASVDSYRSEKIGKDLKGIVNYVIMKGGLDPKGHPIQTPYVNYTSVSKVGYKFKVIVSENNAAKTLLDGDMISYGDEKEHTYNTFPKEIEDGDAFTTTWVATADYVLKKSSISVVKDNDITIDEGSISDNKKAYVELIRTEVKQRLLAEATRLTENLQYGKLKYDVEFQPGQQVWGLGEKITVSNNKLKSGTPTVLRIQEIQDTQNSIKYSMEEDIGTIGN